MSTPSPLDEALAPERLTEALRRSGSLDGGRVSEVTVETSRTTLISTVDRLRLRYENGTGPATLIQAPAVWWSHIERSMQALEDLDCRALLG